MPIREDVLIVLNEREPLKHQMAAELELLLRAKHLAAQRLDLRPGVLETITKRTPCVLVLDYLLGDFGTALDILPALRAANSETQTRVILWTDEPSVYAAVEALKLGAVDYIKIDSSRSIQLVLQAIEKCLTAQAQQASTASLVRAKQQLVYQARNSRTCLAQAESAAARSVPVCIVKGGAGCGRNALAEFIHSQRRRPGVLTEIALDLWPGEATAIFGPSSSGGNSSLLSCAATVVIDHAEYDTGEILESAARLLQDTGGQKNETMLIIGTSVEETAQAWQRLTDAEIIEIPGLNARTEDFLPLMQRIHGEAARLYPIKAFEASSAFLRTLLAMSWPGNIKQFRSAVLEALTTTHFAPHSGALEGPDDAVRELLQIEDYAGLNTEERQIIAAIAEAKARWLRFRRASNYVPDTLAASSALEKANGNLRLAAAYLGTGILQLKSALQSSFGQQP